MKILSSVSVKPAKREQAVADMDHDGDGVMTQTEVMETFVTAYLLLNPSPSSEQLRALCGSIGLDANDTAIYDSLVDLVIQGIAPNELDDDGVEDTPRADPNDGVPEETEVVVDNDNDDADDADSEEDASEESEPGESEGGAELEDTNAEDDDDAELESEVEDDDADAEDDEGTDSDEAPVPEDDDEDKSEKSSSPSKAPNLLGDATEDDGVPGDPPSPDAEAMRDDGELDIVDPNPEDDSRFHA